MFNSGRIRYLSRCSTQVEWFPLKVERCTCIGVQVRYLKLQVFNSSRERLPLNFFNSGRVGTLTRVQLRLGRDVCIYCSIGLMVFVSVICIGNLGVSFDIPYDANITFVTYI